MTHKDAKFIFHGPGDVEELPEGTAEYNPKVMRIRPTVQEEDDLPSLRHIEDASTSGQASAEGGAKFSPHDLSFFSTLVEEMTEIMGG